MRYFILVLLILGSVSWATEEIQVADAYVHPETRMILFRIERSERPRPITFMQREHFIADATEGPFPIGWYYYKPGSGVAYQQRLISGEFWSIRENHIDFNFSIQARRDDPLVEVTGKYEKMSSGGAITTDVKLRCDGKETCFVPQKELNLELTNEIKEGKIDLAQAPEVRTALHVYKAEDGTVYIVDVNMESLSINDLDGWMKTAQLIRASGGELEFADVAKYEQIKDERDRLWPGKHYVTRLLGGDVIVEEHPTLEQVRENKTPPAYFLSEGNRTYLKAIGGAEAKETIAALGIPASRYTFPIMPTPCQLLLKSASEAQ